MSDYNHKKTGKSRQYNREILVIGVGWIFRWWWSYSQRAPAAFRRGTKVPLMWQAMRVSIPPKNLPPTKTAGTECWPPASWYRTDCISEPYFSLSSSTIVGPTPRPKSSCFITWHMQQPLMLNTTTALLEPSLLTASYVVSGFSWASPSIPSCSSIMPDSFICMLSGSKLQYNYRG